MPGLMPVNQEPIVIVVATPSLSLDALQIEIKLYLQNSSAYTVLMSGNVSLDLVLEMLDCKLQHLLLISRQKCNPVTCPSACPRIVAFYCMGLEKMLNLCN